jgi:hypothetical protein
MHLQLIDWVIVLATLLICFVPALFFGKRAGKSTSEFFVSGRAVPWWLAGLSMVATTVNENVIRSIADRRACLRFSRAVPEDWLRTRLSH